MRLGGGLPRLWNRGLARKSLIKREPTFNPAPAAAFLLRVGVVKPTLWSQGHARRRLTKRRPTRTHNPLPAAIALAPQLAGLVRKIPIVGGLAGRLRKPSEQRAAESGRVMLDSAVKGNLTAAKAIAQRTSIGISKERQVWIHLVDQIPQQVIDEAMRDQNVPGVDQSNPESAERDSLARAYYGKFAQPGQVGVQYERFPSSSSPDVLSTLYNAGRSTSSGGAPRYQPPSDRSLGGGTGTRSRARGGGRSSAMPLTGDPSSWTRAERRRAGLTVAKVSRWNPDTERTEKVWADSPQARNWPTVTQGKQALKQRKQLERAAGQAAGAVPGALAAGGKAVAGIGAAAGLGGAATGAAIVGAFAVGWAIGRGLVALWEHFSPEERNFRKAMAFRQARADWAREHGRPMTKAEVQDMGRGFKASLSATPQLGG